MVRTVLRAPIVPDLRQALLAALGPRRLDSTAVVLVAPTVALARDLVRSVALRDGFCAGVRCTTPVGLALALTAPERDRSHRTLLGAEARAWLVRRLQGARDRRLTSFDSVLHLRGFRSALLRAFETLGQAGLATRADVERALVRGGLELPLQARQALELDLAWRKSFESTHDDAASLLARAASTPPGRCAEMLADRVLWFGFESMSSLERRLLLALGRDPGLEIRVYAPSADDEDGTDFLAAAGFEIESRRHTAPEKSAATLRVLSCPSVESEAEEVARVLLAAADRGTRFDRMAVQVPHPERLDLLRTALPRRGIPCVFTPGRSLAASRCGRSLLFFLDLLDEPLAPEPALAFLTLAPLRPGWAGLEADATASAWQRAARDSGVGRGFADWRAKLERHAAALEETAAALDAESEPSQRARAAAHAAVELLAAAAAIESERASFRERWRWSEYVAATEALLDRVFETSDEVGALRRSLERLRSLDGVAGGGVSRPEFCDAIRTLLAETRVEAEAAAVGVRVGTAAALDGFEFDLVVLAAVQEGAWPGAPPHDPVLRERERAALRPLLAPGDTLGSAEDEVERERRLFWRACAAASRQLVLAYARLDAVTGAECLPSPLVLELVGRREGRSIDYEALLSLPYVERVPLHRTSFPDAAPALGIDEIDVLNALSLSRAGARRYVAGLGHCARRGIALDQARNRWPRFTSVDGMIGSQAARTALAARFARPSLSASQLQVYATCPFRYFLRYVLRVEPLERADRRDLSALEAGRLAHRILETFYRELAAAGRDLPGCDDLELDTRLDAACATIFTDAEASGRSASRLLWTIRTGQLREDLRQFLQRERGRDEHFSPVRFETRFVSRGEAAVRVHGSAGEVVGLHGLVDRVDADPQSDAIRVVDYKSGRLPGRERDPAASQLAVYLWAMTGGDVDRLETSEGIFAAVTRKGGFARRRLPGASLAARRSDFVRLVLGTAAAVRDGQFPPVPGPGAAHCKFCDYAALCEARVVEQSERKARSGQLEEFRRWPDFGAALEDGG